MSPARTGLSSWAGALEAVASAFADAEVRLCGYDGIIGDGDHGTSMAGGFREAVKSLAGAPAKDCGDLFLRVGQGFIDTVGGVTGIVFGSLFTAAGEAADGLEDLDAAALHRMFAAGLASAAQRGKAAVGDKSMLDALSPAVDALHAAAEKGETVESALAAAARAAERGMEATIPMEARVGRARYQHGKGAGHVDAGAASVSLFFQVLATGCART